jgi:type 2 lantibiotic biosynthesis protein LanM
MEAFFERLIARAATIDEILSGDFEAQPGQTGDSELATARITAWSRASANGDAGLFRRRLERDGLTYDDVLKRLSSAVREAPHRHSVWIDDAAWIESALQSGSSGQTGTVQQVGAHAFEHLLFPVVEQAETRLWTAVGTPIRHHFTEAGRADLLRMLLDQLTDLCAPPLYERFAAARGEMPTEAAPTGPGASTALYDRFVADMKAGGFRRLFEEKPVLLRLIATLTRQWIEAVHEFASRLDVDIEAIRRDLIRRDGHARVARIAGDLSDRHNGGRSVFIVTFEDGARAVYKPKDLRLDVAWHALIARLNASTPPLDLRAAGVIACDHYGWAEFIDHTGVNDQTGCEMYFRRAGAWLALFHCFAATDMHQENIIAAGDQPVPIDLETILQPPGPAPKAHEAESAASDDAADMIANSVMAVGILPAYGRAPDTSVFAMGALTADWNSRIKLSWIDINTDNMRPTRTKLVDTANPNLPHVDGRYARFGDHIDAFVAGFEDYARFLSRQTRGPDQGRLFEGFAGAPVRKVVRPTRFYSMLLQRLKTHRSMDDGAAWSAQADFIARLSDWDEKSDPNWPFHRAERSALLALNVPHFVLPSDGHVVSDFEGPVATFTGATALERAQTRLRDFDEREVAWQTAVIRANTTQTRPSNSADALRSLLKSDVAATDTAFASESDRIASEISEHAIRRGGSASWIGLDWMGDAEVFQLAPLGPDLYNGVSGIAVFLAAHSAVASHAPSAELALAALTHLRRKLKDRNAARFARSLGIGGATGLGSLVYALTVISRSPRQRGRVGRRPCGIGPDVGRPDRGGQAARCARGQRRRHPRPAAALPRYTGP